MGFFDFFTQKSRFSFSHKGRGGKKKWAKRRETETTNPDRLCSMDAFRYCVAVFFFVVVVAFFLFFFAQKLASTGMLASRGERGREKVVRLC